ncbi:MAG: glycosyltransferase family 2 protein [Bacteroidota bacterium]|nr:glycosyltransferase family 2 protein [Bacteroidota bacterium]
MFEKPVINFSPATERRSDELFSILIPTWNNLPYLKFCIDSILKNSFYKHQIIVHVNEGTDGTLEWIKEQGFSYTASNQNAGVCYALNAMSTLAVTDYIVYMNDDMYACKNWDYNLFEEIKKKADCYFYFSGTMIEFEDTGNKAVLAPYDFGQNPETFDETGLCEFVSRQQHPDWYGASWPPSIVHKKLWNQVQGYSTEYSPGFYSDPDFAMKLWNAGVRDFRGIGSSLVYHFRCKSTGRVMRNDGRKTFAKKWGFPASFFYKDVLKMGEIYEAGKFLKFPSGIKLWLAKIRAAFIKI